MIRIRKKEGIHDGDEDESGTDLDKEGLQDGDGNEIDLDIEGMQDENEDDNIINSRNRMNP